MDVKNCKMCNRIFNYIGGAQICPGCKQKLEDEFQKVKAYVEEHRSASLAVVAEETEVSVKQIKEWIREERLMLSDASGEVVCDNCGKPIQIGRYCDECKRNMANTFGNMYKKEEPTIKRTNRRDAQGRMRFLDS